MFADTGACCVADCLATYIFHPKYPARPTSTPMPTMAAAIAMNSGILDFARYSALPDGGAMEVVAGTGGTLVRSDGEDSKTCVGISTLREDGGVERSSPAARSVSRFKSRKSTSRS